MAKKLQFDIQEAHHYFSAECFNRAWDFIEKPERSLSDEDRMLQLCLASLWHWTQRQDVTPKNLSVGYWQVSRVFALLKHADLARRYAKLSLEAAQDKGVEPFNRGYAYEAMARAEKVGNNNDEMEKYLSLAHQIAASLADSEDKKLLLADLANIR